MSDLPKAETYTDLIAICPNCGEHNNLEWFEDSEELEEVDCEHCSQGFSCHLPESNYH